MGDLIDRDKIYEAVYDLACKSASVIGGISEDYACGLREAAHMIEEAPAVDAVPPKAHGEWIWHEDEFSYECPACHCQFDTITHTAYLTTAMSMRPIAPTAARR